MEIKGVEKMSRHWRWKRAAMAMLSVAVVALSVSLPARAAEREENERAEEIWREVQGLVQFKDSLRTYGQPDPYGWFRMPSRRYVRLALDEPRGADIFEQALPLNMERMVGRPEVAADDPSKTNPQPQIGEAGITETVAQIMARDKSGPPPARHEEFEPNYPSRDGLPQNPFSPPVSQWPPAPQKPGQKPGAVRPVSLSGRGTPTPYVWTPWPSGTSFDGSTVIAGYPPDSIGAVGPTQVVCANNTHIRCFNKDGSLGPLDADLGAFFTSVGGAAGVSDPRVRFDKTSNRWFIVMITVSTPNRVMLAVSSGPTITSASSFTFFFFAAPASTLLDYPTLGVDKNALYIGGNMFAPSFVGSNGYVIRKSSVLGSGPIVVTTFPNLCTSSGAGPYTPQGVHNDDPNATEGYFVGVDNATFGTLMVRRVSNPGGTPTISANIPLTVPATRVGTTVPCLGTAGSLDNLDDRLFDAQMHINRLTGVASVWAAHNIGVDTTGVALSGGRNGSRWYQLGSMTTTPALIQSGTVFDSTATTTHYWIPGMMMNGQGHAILGSSSASTTQRATVSINPRLSTDALGTTRTPVTVITSTFNYSPQGGGKQRWGDYSTTFIDPADDMTFWTFQEYCNQTNVWGVRVAKLLAPAPAAIASIAPNSINSGDTLTLTVTGTSSDGTGYFDPNVAGYPDPTLFKRLAAAFSGTGVTVNSVTFTSPTSLTLNVTAAGNAAPGTRTLGITNPDGQTVSGADVLNVVAVGTVSGTVSLQSVVNSTVPITFEFRPQPSGTVFSRITTLNASGGYSLPAIPTGIYLVGIKGARWLRKTLPITVTQGPVALNATLKGGDGNNNNAVDISDLLPLIAAYNQVQGAPGSSYTVNADFNNDGTDDISDLLILISNYNTIGDP